MLAAVLSVGGAVWAWESGYRPPFLAADRLNANLVLLEVDQGDVIEFIVENGSLESATNTVVRCEVEALMGMVGGSSGSGSAAGAAIDRGLRRLDLRAERLGNLLGSGKRRVFRRFGRRSRFRRRGDGQGQVEGGLDEAIRKRELRYEQCVLGLRSKHVGQRVGLIGQQ